MGVSITAFYAGLLGLILLGLSAGVIRQRYRSRVGVGHGGDARLERWTRIHGNFTEYAPLVLVLMALVELQGAPAWLLHALGAAFTLGRLAHAQGLASSAETSPGRAAGMIATFTVLFVASVLAIVGFLDG